MHYSQTGWADGRPDARPDLRFDERLPLYGWLEDLDYCRRMSPYGRIQRSSMLVGVHMGVKGGRQSGVRLGYSQVANPIYFVIKGSMPAGEAFVQVLRHRVHDRPDRQGRRVVAERHLQPARSAEGFPQHVALGGRDGVIVLGARRAASQDREAEQRAHPGTLAHTGPAPRGHDGAARRGRARAQAPRGWDGL
mgnify:CR=1 FL=1